LVRGPSVLPQRNSLVAEGWVDRYSAHCPTPARSRGGKCRPGRAGRPLPAPKRWPLVLSAPRRAGAQRRCAGGEGGAVSTRGDFIKM